MKVLSQLSGGIDSVAALAEVVVEDQIDTVFPIFFDYGQPYAAQELKAALYATRHFQDLYPNKITTLLTVSLPLRVVSTTDVAEYVPMRNLALTAVSVNYAASLGCHAVVVGSKSALWRPGDAYSFKDSTWAFFAQLEAAIAEGTEPKGVPVCIAMPVMGWTKNQAILRLLRADVNLKKLWSCYRDGPEPCGECYHCQEIEKSLHDPEIQAYMHREVMS